MCWKSRIQFLAGVFFFVKSTAALSPPSGLFIDANHLSLMPRLKMLGSLLHCPLYAFMVWHLDTEICFRFAFNALFSFCLYGCFHCCGRGRPSRMKSRERRRHWRRSSDAGGLSADLLRIIKHHQLTVTIQITLREVGVAAMYAPIQTPGGGRIFL